MNVLIVDDNPEIVEILEIIMEDDGHKTYSIYDGDYLFNAVKEFNPDLILLDVRLGKHDGRKLCSSLKNGEATKHIPILIISASHMPETFQEMGCTPNGYIPKPFDINEVSTIVNSFA